MNKKNNNKQCIKAIYKSIIYWGVRWGKKKCKQKINDQSKGH